MCSETSKAELICHYQVISVWSQINPGSKIQEQLLTKKKILSWVVACFSNFASVNVWKVRTGFRLALFPIFLGKKTVCTCISVFSIWTAKTKFFHFSLKSTSHDALISPKVTSSWTHQNFPCQFIEPRIVFKWFHLGSVRPWFLFHYMFWLQPCSQGVS